MKDADPDVGFEVDGGIGGNDVVAGRVFDVVHG